MKTIHMVLIAAISLSAHATSFCMESTPTKVTPLVRKNSHDGTRRSVLGNSGGMFGSGIDTLEKLGQPFGKDHVYALGSDADAPNRWAQVGKKDIKTLVHAIKFKNAIEYKGWNLPAEALQPSLELIEADRQVNIAASSSLFNSSDQKLAASLLALQARYKNREKEDAQAVEDLKTLALEIHTMKINHNKNYPDSRIELDPCVKHPKNITLKTLAPFVENFSAKQAPKK